MPLLSSEITSSIRFRIIASLFIILSLSMGTALFGIWIYERDQLIDSYHKEAMRAGRTIEKSLRTSMLNNDREAVQLSITEISEIIEPQSRISIVANDGSIAFSSDKSLVGTILNRQQDPSCMICHVKKDVIPIRNAVMIDSPDGPLLRNVIKIVNQPPCYACHDSSRKNLGILLYDAFFANTYDMLRTVALRTLLTGLLTFLVVIITFVVLVNRLIHQPIQAMIHGFTQVGMGKFEYWVELDDRGEFSEMADWFNVMSRAIGRYIDEVKLKNQEILTLYTFVQQISKTLDSREIKKIIVTLMSEVFKMEQNILVIPLENQQADCYELVWHNQDEARLFHKRYCLDATNLPSLLLSKEELLEWHETKYTTPHYKDNDSRVLIPLIFNDTLLGLICVAKDKEQRFSRSEKKLIPALANHMTISLDNSRLYHMAITDSLTGLYTKRYLTSTLSKHVSACHEEQGRQFCLMMLDLDHFKEVNDTHGHQAGDQILMQIADLIRENIRYGDIPYRYGGEEFVVILPDTCNGLAQAIEVASRLRKSVEDHAFTAPGCPAIYKTVSIGIACCPEHAASAAGTIEIADQALYEAKENGRNQVRCPPNKSE